MKAARRAFWPAAMLGVMGLTMTANQAAPRSGDVALDLKHFKVVAKADGKEELVAANEARPGEIIEYQLRCTNEGARDIADFQPSIPIPAGLEFVPKSATPDEVTASTDGRTWGAIPLKRTLKLAGGEEKVVPVPYREYRFIRWSAMALGAGKSLRMSVRARVAGVPQTDRK